MKKVLFLLSALVVSVTAFSQVPKDSSFLEPISETVEHSSIFDDDEPMNLTLKYDITSFTRHKLKGEYLDAELIIHFDETDSIVKNIRLKARGNFRRGYCFFPPIYLNFKTDPIEDTDLKGIKKVKLVTHCHNSSSYQDYILKEYLAYKIYNKLSDFSFRVKLVNITYIDTGKKGKTYTKEGFLIEPLKLLVKRTNSVEVDPKFVNGRMVKEPDMDRVALYEYFIANTDWRIKGGHNVKYVKSLDEVTPQVIPIPYDFDYSGFVNTSYSEPQEWASVKSVTEREYLGYCRSNKEDLLAAIDLFVQNKENITSTISNFQYLSEKGKIRLLDFIESFYEEAENPNVMIKVLDRECRDMDF